MAVLRDSGVRPPVPRFSALGLKAMVLAAISVSIMVVDYRQQHLQVIRSALTTAVYPLQLIVHSPIAAWQSWQATMASRDSLLSENANLKQTVQKDEIRLLRLIAAERENVRLRALLGAAPRVAERVAMASVMRIELDAFRQRVLIDKGSRDQVFKGQSVIDAYGVVGQVSNVGPVSAEVILLSDNTHSIPVQVSRNELRTIATGSGDPRRLSLNYLPRAADVKVDDVLLSSGLGGVFPAGYPVGRVVEVRRDASQPLLSISVEPYARLDRDQEVLLVWFDKPSAPPPPPEVAKPATGKRRAGTPSAADAAAADAAGKTPTPDGPAAKPDGTTKPAPAAQPAPNAKAPPAAVPGNGTAPPSPARADAGHTS